VAFVPSNPLSYDTIYTVTIKNGFCQKADGQSLKEDTVFSFQTIPEPDKSNQQSGISFEFARNVYNFYPHELPFISVYTNIDDAEVEFCIYQYHNDQEFRDDLYAKDDRPNWCIHNNNNKIDYSDKEEVFNITSMLLPDKEKSPGWYYGAKYIELPESLPEGYYIAVIRHDGIERKALVQINSMAVYVGRAENKTIGFIYDSLTSNPIEGAEIVFDKFSIKTGNDGIAVSDDVLISEDSSHLKNYTIKRDGHPPFYSTLGKEYNYYSSNYYYNYYTNFRTGNIQNKYWGYLFTDRDMYLPSDTLNVWGMLADKDGNEAPREVTIRLSKYSTYYYSQDSYSVIDEKKAILTGVNTFKSSISFENLSSDYYNLEIFSGDEMLLSKSIYIKEYAKPIYTINTSIDKKVVANGEKLRFEMETKFFEGTPVSGMDFFYSSQ
jgi:hypothetical protein